MVGPETAFWLYQNSGPALQIVLLCSGGYLWQHEIQPRLSDLEEDQDEHEDRWEDQRLNAQERALLIDNAHSRIGDVEDVNDRLQERLRVLEQEMAAEQGQKLMRGGSRDDDGGAD